MEPLAISLLRWPNNRIRAILIAASLVFVCRCLVAIALVPPWQQPDEPTHVALAEWQRSRIAGTERSPDPAREREVLQSMVDHDFWIHRAEGWTAPVRIPERFMELGTGGGRAVVEVVGNDNPSMYFLLAGRLFSWLPARTVTTDLYLLRGLSALLGLLSLWVAWLGARECLGEPGGAIVALLLAFHPQFVMVSTSATPDQLVNALGACLWWQAAVAVRRQRALVPLLVIWAAAIASAAADRMGLPLVAAACLASLLVLAMAIRQRLTRASVVVVMVVFMGTMLAAAAWAVYTFGRTYDLTRIFSTGWVPVPGAVTWDRFARFNWSLHQTWWYSLGWGRYTAPAWWTAAAAAITIMALIGAGRRLATSRTLDGAARALVALAAIFIAVQLAAVYWTYFRLGNGAQGRYLFPFLVPSLVIMWIGIESWAGSSHRAHAAAALVLVIAIMDAAAWLLVAMPAYYASF